MHAAYYGYKLEPNQKGTYTLDKPVVTNSFGFRDHEWEVPKPRGRMRVMVLGDSLTFGNGARAEDSFPKLLEKRLKALGDVDVLNASVGGWNTDNEEAVFSHEGIRSQRPGDWLLPQRLRRCVAVGVGRTLDR